MEDSLDEIREMLRHYKKGDIKFNEPHFTIQMRLREGNRDEVISNILNPEKLVYSYSKKGRHVLHFRISNTKTVILPAVCRKTLYILTYIMRHRGVFKK